MGRLLGGLIVAVVAVLVLSSAASAITIYEIKGDKLADPTKWYDYFGSSSSYSYALMWDPAKVAADGKTLLPGGRPTGEYSAWAGANPGGFHFDTGTGSSGGGGSPGGSEGVPQGNVQTRGYTLQWDSATRFDYSVMFYDPGIDASITDDTVIARVILTGENGTLGDIGNARTLTAADVRAGTMVSFDITADALEKFYVTVESVDTYAAGFFLSNVTGAVPEPASLALLALGACGMILRRRGRVTK
jgi:hypothetical protein